MSIEKIEYTKEFIRQLRKDRKLSKKKMEVESGIPEQTIKSWEMGWRKPNEENLGRLNEFFNVNMSH